MHRLPLRPLHLHRMLALVALFLSGMTVTIGQAQAAAAEAALQVSVVSSQPGHVFPDSQPVRVAVVVTGAHGAVAIDYVAHEVDGEWQQAGSLSLVASAGGGVRADLPLEPPGRGLYRLDVASTSGGETASTTTWVAVVFTPSAPESGSPWGVFWTAHGGGPQTIAESVWLLGASWVRFNFWAFSFGRVSVSSGPTPTATADWSTWKEHARALRRRGLFIMGEVAQCPRELSSRSDVTDTTGDAGGVWARVKPRDYAVWDGLMERLAAEFRQEIGVWEIWNEPNIHFWEGTAAEYAELVAHTGSALRRGNPDARIAAGGFVGGFSFVDSLLGMGLGESIDILTVHYTDEKPWEIERWRDLLRKYGLDLPIWNSEEKSEAPLRNMAGGVERSFKFLHVAFSPRYDDYRPLVRKDLTALPAGVAFSVGAHCVGDGRFLRQSADVPGFEVCFFQRGTEEVAVFQRPPTVTRDSLLGPVATEVTLHVQPLRDDAPVTVTDLMGRTQELQIVDGRGTVCLERALHSNVTTPYAFFVNGARSVRIGRVKVVGRAEGTHVFDAESGRWSSAWGVAKRKGMFGDRSVDIWAEGEPEGDGHWVEVDLEVADAGAYDIAFAGNDLAKRIGKPRTLSPFAWQVDGGEEHRVEDPVRDLVAVPGDLSGLSGLGTVELAPGKHVFRLCLLDRRDKPDTRYALWFDALVLRLRSPRPE